MSLFLFGNLTSWLNSHADFGDEHMMTSFVLGTSSPMQPAEVDNRARADLRRVCCTAKQYHLPFPVGLHHLLLLSSGRLASEFLIILNQLNLAEFIYELNMFTMVVSQT